MKSRSSKLGSAAWLDSESVARAKRRDRETVGQRGVVIVLFTIVIVVLLLGAGLAVDLGLAHVTMSRLSKAVDAGALSGARHSTEVLANIERIALEVASANYGANGDGAMANYKVAIDHPSTDTYRVRVHGETDSPAFFSRLMGRESLDVAAVAEATRWPLDVSLVLDLSGSLKRNDAFDDMQEASKSFLDNFNDEVDRFGIVTYSTWAQEAMPMQKRFKLLGKDIISGLAPLSDTNIEEGMRLGKLQLDSAMPRPKALRILVLFTDGRPTAFADALRMDKPVKNCASAPDPSAFNARVHDEDADGFPDCWAGAIATGITGPNIRGIFRADNGMKVIGFSNNVPDVEGNGSTTASPSALRLPQKKTVTGDNIRALAISQSEEWASAARAAGYTIFAVGLGNPDAAWIGDSPDLDFLRRLANEDGRSNSTQPRGEMLFAPSPAELRDTFTRLADRILTRLTL